MTCIARAGLTDIEGIGSVIHEVWGQRLLPEVAKAQIEDEACALWIAREGGSILGFTSAFLTRSRTGERRWEVDLLAVRTSSRGHGLGQRLIQRVYQDGERHGALLARAAIRVDNVPSQVAFQKIGFSTDSQLHHLFLWEPEADVLPSQSLDRVSLIPVDTLTYRGVWIEGLQEVSWPEQRAAVRAARALAAREQRLNTGALIPIEGSHEPAPDLQAQTKRQGGYFWFVRPYTTIG